jgi:hypothetical protein
MNARLRAALISLCFPCLFALQQMADEVKTGEWRLFKTTKKSTPKLGKVISYDAKTNEWILQPYGARHVTGSLAHCCCYQLVPGKNERRLKAAQIGGIGCHSVGLCQKQGRHADHGAGDGYYGLLALPLQER